MKERPVLFSAYAVADAHGVVGIGDEACLLVDAAPDAATGVPRLLASGRGARRHPLAAVAERMHRPRSVLLPGLVNAHTHLDLSMIGPRAHDPGEGFMSWVDLIRTSRPQGEEEIAAAVRRGVELSLRGGTVAVGDIAGAPRGVPSLTAWETLRGSAMLGVSFVEFFAMGKGAAGGMRAIGAAVEAGVSRRGEGHGVQLGVQPHAPNTVGLAGYVHAVELARRHGLALSTHLAETWEERLFVGEAAGPQRAFLERLGLWDDAMLAEIGQGRRPVEHLAGVLARAKFLAAHVNDADAAAIETLARTGTTVVYCPRASGYFGAEARFGAHRYREMLAAGVPVALGTDSIVNLDTPDRISVLDEMRLLWRRDRTDPRLLLRMGTVHGAKALGLDPAWFELVDMGGLPRGLGGVVGVEVEERGDDPLERVMAGRGVPELLLGRNHCG